MPDARVSRLRDGMDDADLNALVLTVHQNVRYATGYHSIFERWELPEPAAAAIVPRDPDLPVTLVIPEANVALVAVAAGEGQPLRMEAIEVFDLLTFCEVSRVVDPHAGSGALASAAREAYADLVVGPCHPDVIHAIAGALERLKLSSARLGFDDLRVAAHVNNGGHGVAAKVTDALDLTLKARVVKTPEEIEIFRRIGRIGDEVIQEAAGRLEPGLDWNAFQADVADMLTRRGAMPVDEGAMLFGGSFAGEFIPELFRTRHDRPLAKGQVVILETLGIAEGYWIDINRTAVIGDPTPEYQWQHDMIRDTFLEVVEAMRPGVTTGALAKQALEGLTRRGVPSPEKLLLLGHGLGLQPLEFPLPYPSQGLAGGRGFTLEKDMVVSLDCLYYGSKIGPCHMENVFVIEDGGASSTYSTPLELLGPRGI